MVTVRVRGEEGGVNGGKDSCGDSEAAHVKEGTGHSPGTWTERRSDTLTGRVRKGERHTGTFPGVRSL